MGSGESKHECRGTDNITALHYTKQYFTINKAINILLDIENGKVQALTPAVNYMIDLNGLIPDIMLGSPTEISTQLYSPVEFISGVHSNLPIKVLYTALHKYNDYILKELPVIETTDELKISRATKIREELIPISQKLLTLITDYCNVVGIVDIE